MMFWLIPRPSRGSFTALTIIGSHLGQPTGLWWTWDALDPTVCCRCHQPRALIEEESLQCGAILGIIGSRRSLIHMSVWWRTLHQPSILRPDKAPGG
jgi:hypothetical protein